MKTNNNKLKIDKKIYKEILLKIKSYINSMKYNSRINNSEYAFEYKIKAETLIELLEVNIYNCIKTFNENKKEFFPTPIEERYEWIIKQTKKLYP